jgi:endonuclease/exonuclease/phosphatase family metal-dependent hydrolase
MTEIPASQASRRHRILAGLVWIAWSLGVVATALAFTAPWVPAFDLINDARPFGALAALALLLAAMALREWRLIRPTAALALLHAGLLLLPWGRAADAAPNAPAALRLLTFALPSDSGRLDDIADFVLTSGADIVLLQDVSCTAADRLIPKLRATFPNAFVPADGCDGQALLAKRPWGAVGQVITTTRKPLLIWARFQWNGSAFTLTGVRLAGPRAPNQQAADLERLRAHLSTQGPAQIVAGNFNLTPFTWKFAQLNNAGLGQHATYRATWPAERPLLLMDNVLSSADIASVRATIGPPLGAAHRPLIADIAFVK